MSDDLIFISLVKLFEEANRSFLENETDLISSNVSEQCLCSTLMKYIDKQLVGTMFSQYYCDVEYNRYKINGSTVELKYQPDNEQRFYEATELVGNTKYGDKLLTEEYQDAIYDLRKLSNITACDLVIHGRGNDRASDFSIIKHDQLLALEMDKDGNTGAGAINRLIQLTGSTPLPTIKRMFSGPAYITLDYICGIYYKLIPAYKTISIKYFRNGEVCNYLGVENITIANYLNGTTNPLF